MVLSNEMGDGAVLVIVMVHFIARWSKESRQVQAKDDELGIWDMEDNSRYSAKKQPASYYWRLQASSSSYYIYIYASHFAV